MIKFSLKPLFLLLFLAAETFFVQAQTDVPGITLIDGKSMLKTVEVLSAPDMEGRQPGSEAYERAAAYMRDAFASLGLKPAGEDGYFQHVPAEYVQITEDPELQRLEGGTQLNDYKVGDHFVCRGLTGFGDVTAQVVFCGYGISEPESGYDDYAGIDVKGKIVMVFKQNPSWKIGKVDFSQKYNRYRANIAAAHGAVGLLLVSTPLSADPQKPIGSLMDGEGTYDVNMPQLHIDLEVAQDFLAGSDWNIKRLQTVIDSTKKPHSVELKYQARIMVRGEYTAEKVSSNVVALMEGSDPVLNKEFLVISAHLDHVGKQGHRLYFPGANDNASGSAAVLQLATAFAKLNEHPKRSILFVLYTGEEQGLVGSNYFAQHCPVDEPQIVAAFNLDCVGYGDSIQVGCGKSNPVLWKMAQTQDSLHFKHMISNTWGGGGADLEGLYKLGIPGLYFASRYSYTHLHLPSDVAATLNVGLYQELVRLAYRVVYLVAQGQYAREPLMDKK